jgi:hypothetical protein
VSFSARDLERMLSREHARKVLGEKRPAGSPAKRAAYPLRGMDAAQFGRLADGGYVLTVLGWTPAPLNQLDRNRWTRSKLKSHDRKVVGCAQHLVGIPPAEGRRSVSLQLVIPPGERRCDPDAYWKSTLDALVHAKLLVNDSPKWVKHGAVGYARDHTRATRIILHDITPEET